jgi:hypothetical protein
MEWVARWSPILWRIYELNAESKKLFGGGQVQGLPGTILSAA